MQYMKKCSSIDDVSEYDNFISLSNEYGTNFGISPSHRGSNYFTKLKNKPNVSK